MNTDPETTLESLVAADVLESSSDRTELSLSTAFLDAVDRRTADRDALVTALEKRLERSRLVTCLEEEADDRFLARLCELSDRGSFSDRELLQLSLVLDQFGDDRPRVEGAPEGFLPVRGDRIGIVVRTYPAAVVYAWREACPPCDDVKQTLEATQADAPDELGRFAVYGPNWARELQNRYDVVGAPTTLFVGDGRIESRIQGAREPTVFRAEIDTIRERPA